MRIAVCIKQVPASQEAKMDPQKGILIRDGAPMAVNPYDIFAIEMALQFREKMGGEIAAFTMGPLSADQVLREAFAMGVERGYLLTDWAFAGADTLATSYALSQAITIVGGFDIIFCGRQTTDGDTAQVGPSIGAFLGLPFLSWIQEIVSFSADSITVIKSITGGQVKAQVDIPCLLSIDKNVCQPRLPSLRNKLEAKKKEIDIIRLVDMPDTHPGRYGLEGSPTRVERIFQPERAAKGRAITGDIDQIADVLVEKLLVFAKQRDE